MKYFISYTAKGVPESTLNGMLLTTRRGLEDHGAEVYCTRFLKEPDYEQFQPESFDDYMDNAYRHIKAAERLFLLAANPHIGTGLALELGYAKGAGLPIIIANRISAGQTTLSGQADYMFNYETHDELREGISNIPTDLSVTERTITSASAEARHRWQQYIRHDLPPLATQNNPQES